MENKEDISIKEWLESFATSINGIKDNLSNISQVDLIKLLPLLGDLKIPLRQLEPEVKPEIKPKVKAEDLDLSNIFNKLLASLDKLKKEVENK